MIDIVVLHQALIREWINGAAAVLCLTLTCMIVVFMWDTMVYYSSNNVRLRRRAGEIVTQREWQHAPGVPVACALFWIFSAEAYRAAAVWALYQMGKAGGSVGTFFAPAGLLTSYGYLIAGLALNAGLLRAIYYFSPPDWKRRVWKLAAVAAVLFCASPSIIFKLARIYFYGF